MKRNELPADQYQPTSITLDVTIPALWKATWRWARSWLRRVPQTEVNAASLYVAVTVIWPNGSITTTAETIRGKSSSPYTRRITMSHGQKW